jgi:hypothetical protein
MADVLPRGMASDLAVQLEWAELARMDTAVLIAATLQWHHELAVALQPRLSLTLCIEGRWLTGCKQRHHIPSLREP